MRRHRSNDALDEDIVVTSEGASVTTWRVVTVSLMLVSAFAGTVILASRSPRGEPANNADLTPPVVLWAWERLELLGFIDPNEVEAAILVGTLTLTSDSVHPHPRQQPLELPRATRRTAVVRIESDRPRLTPAQRRQAVAAILAWTQTSPGYAAVQIDFDATVSERLFYRRLLEDLRRELPVAIPLSITALASWCLGDRWLEDLPIDEAVPMLFRMGIDEDAIRTALARGDDFRDPRCRTSYGLATDEPLPPMRPGRRLYVFHPEAWTETAYGNFRQALALLEKHPHETISSYLAHSHTLCRDGRLGGMPRVASRGLRPLWHRRPLLATAPAGSCA